VDFFGLPESTLARRYVFGPTGAAGGSDFAAWRKPRGCSMLHIFCLGSGGSGGGGAGEPSNADSGGGGGGASSGFSCVTIPLAVLPDVLYVLVGASTVPGTAGSTSNGGPGNGGRNSRVAIQPDTTVSNILAVSNNAVPGGGAGGLNAAGGNNGGAGGSVPTIATLALMPWASLGIAQFVVGLAGQQGLDAGATSPYTIPLIGQPLPGLGGGGMHTTTPGAGGNYAALANTPFFAGAAAAGGATPGNGDPGHRRWPYHQLYGGAGGGAGGTGVVTGARGGDCGSDAPGCGGGGGGRGNPTGGRGGAGGPGLVILTCW
jgi:hypothetical protein